MARGTLVSLALVVTVALSAHASTGAIAASATHVTTSASHTSTASWFRFHVDLGGSRRADCIETPRVLPKPILRCDRYRTHQGSSTQQLALSIYDGVVRRLRPPPDATGDPVGRHLRASHLWQRGPFTCRARATRLTCRDRNSGHGFVIKRADVSQTSRRVSAH